MKKGTGIKIQENNCPWLPNRSWSAKQAVLEAAIGRMKPDLLPFSTGIGKSQGSFTAAKLL